MVVASQLRQTVVVNISKMLDLQVKMLDLQVKIIDLIIKTIYQ